MKYRIIKSEKGYRALVCKETNSEGAYYIQPIWTEIENDNLNMSCCKRYYTTEDEAIEACKQHHLEKGYNKLPKVVREFEL